MAKTMSQSSRREYLRIMRDRYRRRTGKQARTALLNDFCETTGHERKYAIKLLRNQRGPDRKNAPPKPRGRRKVYSQATIDVLFNIWKWGEQPCGKRLAPMRKRWLPFHEKHFGALDERTLKEVRTISPAQIDRVLAPRKVSHPGRFKRRTPKAASAIKALVPIRAANWDAREPGWLEADTVAHCGGDMRESFLWSLTVTDIFSGWTEVRPTWNRGQHSVCEAFTAIEKHLPFPILGVDTDNGGEFLNHHLHQYFTVRDRPVELSRSRPYHKNDQAHVEQKNSTHVRQLLGHDRLGHEQLMRPVFDLLEAWCVWHNCFCPSFKQIEHRREGGRTVRRHEKVPQTPCDRLIAHCREVGDDTTAGSLETWIARHDPFELKAWIEKNLGRIWKLEVALTEAGYDGVTDLEGVAAPILKRDRRSAPIALQNRKYSSTGQPETRINNQPNQDATESSKAA